MSAYIELIVKSRLSASFTQLFVNSISACLPSVLMSLLNDVISNLLLSITAVIVPCLIPVSRACLTFEGSILVAKSISSTFSSFIIFLTQPPTYLISASSEKLSMALKIFSTLVSFLNLRNFWLCTYYLKDKIGVRFF